MFSKRSNPDLAQQANLALDQTMECQKYVSTLHKQHVDMIWKNKKGGPQAFADALGGNAAKVLKVHDIVAKALNDIAAAVGDDSLKVEPAVPTGASYTAAADGTVTVTLPPPPPAATGAGATLPPPAGAPTQKQA